MSFTNQLDEAMDKNNSLVCVGLDPVLEKLPDEFKSSDEPFFEFNKSIIDATKDLVCAYKPNSAFYEALGAKGIQQLKETCDYINQNYPDIPIILDAKRGDIGSTNNGYVQFAFDYLGCDAITLHPYMGQESLQPFLDRSDKGCIIQCLNSNKGAEEFQSLETNGEKLYQRVAKAVAENWNRNGNCLLVVGATNPAGLKEVRQITGDEMTLLVPGIGAQGGDVEATLEAGLNSNKKGLVINSSRAIIYAENPRLETENLRNKINQSRE
ncbi:MAG TPA: orotidine-5'-phosphate decarboxylase [Candidatus Saccharimonadales bacterium]|nr:orotidine-5'-phosphate decarboxylase [Candidatus Saccharimonadales bacterium]